MESVNHEKLMRLNSLIYLFYLHISVRPNHSPSTARGSPCLLDQGPLPAASQILCPAPTGPTWPKEHRSPAGSGSSFYSGTVGWRCWSACWRRESGLFSKGYHMSLFNIWSRAIKMYLTLLQKQCLQLLDKGSVFLHSYKQSKDLPIISECLSDCLTDELTILLQGVQCILNGLVNCLLNCATHFFDLVHTAAWL